jgi:hypothetical protein
MQKRAFNYLSEDELKKVRTIEELKKQIKVQNEELTLQQKHLIAMMAQIQAVFAQENLQGIELHQQRNFTQNS